MKQINLFTLFLFISFTVKAQLPVGTKTINLNSGFNSYYGKNSHRGLKSGNSSHSLGITPSLNAFVTKNLYVGGTLDFSSRRNWARYDNAEESSSYLKTAVGANLRYYAANNAKTGFFLFSSALLDFRFSKFNKNGAKNNPSPEDYFTWNGGIGGHKMLNEQLAAEATLFYSNSNGNDAINFRGYLANFIRRLDKKSQEATPQYVAKNRVIANGNLSLTYESGAKNFYSNAVLFWGKFFTDRLMLAGGISTFHNAYKLPTGSTNSTGFALAPQIRYYIPLSSRFYLFPYITSTFGVSSNSNSYLIFDKGVGFNHFLTRNVALSGVFSFNPNINNSADVKSTQLTTRVNCGLAYFLN